MRFFQPFLFLAVVAILIQGCAFSRGTLGDDIKTEAIGEIKKGVTTKAEVLALLGAPDRVLPLNGRDVYQYYRYDAKAGSLLLILIILLVLCGGGGFYAGGPYVGGGLGGLILLIIIVLALTGRL